jgi:hypothetical protein
MIILVTGGRDYFDIAAVKQALDAFHNNNPITLLIHGDCKGADRLCARWATDNGVHPVAVPALWKFYNMQAGSTRNTMMLKLPVEYCIAFPGKAGTADMRKKCQEKNIPVWGPYD